jgi:hypothetical protein
MLTGRKCDKCGTEMYKNIGGDIVCPNCCNRIDIEVDLQSDNAIDTSPSKYLYDNAKRRKILFYILRIYCIILLFLAIIGQGQDYYVFFRWVVSPSFLYLAYITGKNEKYSWAAGFYTFGAFLNPIVPLHLSRNFWIGIDYMAILTLLASFYVFKWKDDY